MTLVLQSVFSGLTSGVEISLIGVALVFCFRASRIVNLVEGETYMASAMLNTKMVAWGLPLIAAAPAGIMLAVVGSAAMERFLLRPRLHWPIGRIIILTAGLAILIEGIGYLVVGSNEYSVTPILNGPPLLIHGAAIEQQAVLAIGVSAVVALGLMIFLARTTLGQALSAMAERPMTAELVGINSGRLRLAAYAVAGLLGAIASLLIAPLVPIAYNVGLTLTLSGYIAAAVGDMRRIGVAWAAGMGIGLAESFFGTYVNALLAEPLVLGVLLVGVVALLARGVRFGGARRA